ncbi:MAG: alpha/beta fold hydrolase [Hyphomicrobiales bacterium]
MTTATRSAAEQILELQTGKVRVARQGSGAPLVVLHHDNQAPGWTPFFDELSASFDVIVPDLPGFGGSDRIEWARHPRDFAAVLQTVLDRLEVTSATLVGLGFGGWLAAEMAVNNAQRLRSLVLVNAFGIKPPEGEILDQMLMDFVAYTKAGFSSPARFEELYGEHPSSDQVLVWDYGREVVARIAWKPYMFSHQLPHLVSNLQVPTLVVWSGENRVVPLSAGQEYARLIPGARLEVVAGAGHFLDLEQPAALAQLVRSHAQGA